MPKIDIPSGFTPGPWAQSHRQQTDGMWWATEVYAADDPSDRVATCGWAAAPVVDLPDGSRLVASRREANARLIALAPAMAARIAELEPALAELLAAVEDIDPERLDRAMAAARAVLGDAP